MGGCRAVSQFGNSRKCLFEASPPTFCFSPALLAILAALAFEGESSSSFLVGLLPRAAAVVTGGGQDGAMSKLKRTPQIPFLAN